MQTSLTACPVNDHWWGVGECKLHTEEEEPPHAKCDPCLINGIKRLNPHIKCPAGLIIIF